MSSLATRFKQAVADSKQLDERPSNDVLLQIYALYKQATEGDVQGDPPGMFDLVGRAKHDAWTKKQGLTAEDAMAQYVELIESLR